MENLAVITVFIIQFLFTTICSVLEKIENVIHLPRLVHIGKNCALCLVYGLGWNPKPRAQFFPV